MTEELKALENSKTIYEIKASVEGIAKAHRELLLKWFKAEAACIQYRARIKHLESVLSDTSDRPQDDKLTPELPFP